MENTVAGIDVSHHNGLINWAQVRKLNPQLRVVYVKASEGATYKDPTFVQNVKGAHTAGFEIGAYHFVTPGARAEEQAELFIGRLQLVAGMLTRKPVLDAEQVGTPDAWLSLTIEERIQKLLKIRVAVAKASGMPPKLYASSAFITDVLRSDQRLADFGLWLAAYRPIGNPPKAPKPFADWDGWQYSEKGQLPGLGDGVDLNLWRAPAKP